MPRPFKPFLLAACMLSFSLVHAEEVADDALPQILSSSELGEIFEQEPVVQTPAITEPKLVTPKVAPPAPQVAFTPFTGKVRGNKVRLRVNAELDGYIVKELHKGELVAIVGQKDEFWAVEPLPDTKAYIFRSFVLDNTVEGNHVNIRLEPSLEAPVIGHVNTGDHIDGTISPLNNKWLEFTPPKSIQFYVSKEYIEDIGGPELKVEYEKRLVKAQSLLDTTALLIKAEFNKPFSEIDIERLSHNYEVIINDYSDFPQFADQAKSELSALNEAYLKRKIEYLENKANGVDEVAAVDEEAQAGDLATDKMKLWAPIEESLYLTWARINDDRNMHEYYDEQKLNSVMLTGIVESYTAAVKSKPGSHIIRDEKDLPIGYVYSTNINLDNYIGKKISVVASPRPNNNFAFPAYFVYEVE